VLGDPEEEAGRIAVDHKAAGVGRTAVVAGRRRAVVRVGHTAGAVGRRAVGDLLNGCLVAEQEHESQLERVLGIVSISNDVGWK
jgi:hypothetical protein